MNISAGKCAVHCKLKPNQWTYNFVEDPEPIVIKPFHPKEGAREGTEKVLSSCSINLPNLPNCKHFPLTLCFVNRVHTKPPVFREETLDPSFVHVHISTFSLEQRLIAPVKLSRGPSSFFITTGPCQRLEISLYNVYITNQFQTTFAGGGGGG